MTNTVLKKLDQVIQNRMNDSKPEDSYVALLHHKGLNHILKKLGEECSETIIAAKEIEKPGGKEALIYETADLWFHSLVLLQHLNCDADDILSELEKRFYLSGLVEKANRDK